MHVATRAFSPERLRGCRTAIGKSRTQLAFAVGSSPDIIRRYELGKQVPSANRAAALAAVLGVEVGQLFESGATDLDSVIDRIVAAAPELSDEQMARLQRFFAPVVGA